MKNYNINKHAVLIIETGWDNLNEQTLRYALSNSRNILKKLYIENTNIDNDRKFPNNALRLESFELQSVSYFNTS